MLSVLGSVQSIHLWRRSTKFSKWREYEWKYSIIWIIFLQIENIAEQRTMYREHHYAGCWLTIIMQIKILELLVDQFNFEKVKVLRKCLNFILLSVEVEQVGHLYQFSEPVSPNLTFAPPIFKIWLCLPQFHSFASQIFFPLLNWKYAAPSCQLSTFNAPQEQVREITHIFDIFTNRQ